MTALARLGALAALALGTTGCLGTPGARTATPGEPTSVRDLSGRPVDPLNVAGTGTRAVVLLFADPQCPISNAYAPEVGRLHAEFAGRGVAFWLVYADAARTADEVRAHVASFGYAMPAVLDPAHELTHRAGATITPEAGVFLPDGELVYRGRIDDRYVDFGKQRAAPTTRDLRIALLAVLAGERPAEPWQAAIGCSIPEQP